MSPKKAVHHNRVWLELEIPEIEGNGKKFDHKLGEARAAAATAVLRKLGEDVARFQWSEEKSFYLLIVDEAGTSLDLRDNGHWFNLDAFAQTR